MTSQKLRPNADNQIMVLCPGCGQSKTVDAARFAGRQGPLKAKCACGNVFSFEIDYRRQYRKSVHLFGSYAKTEPSPEKGEITVEDISRTGVQFHTSVRNRIAVGDILKIQFTLDDSHRSVISKNVLVRRIKDGQVGAEFCDNQVDRALAFYLMP